MSITVEQYANAVETTLDGTINSSVTSIVVDDASTFPTAAFRFKIDNEIIWCISRSGNTLSVIRAYEDTTAAAHLDGAFVNHCFTAGSLKALRKRILADCCIIDPTDSMSADDDDFDDENFTGWTTVERSGYASTVVERNHRASILIPGGTAGAQHYGFMKAKSGITAGCWVQAGLNLAGAGGNFPIPGIGFSDGVTYGSGQQIAFNFSPHEDQWFIRGINNWNQQQGSEAGSGNRPYFMGVAHLRLQWNSSNNYTCFVSCDCINWVQIFNGSWGSVGTPTHAGIITTNWGSSNPFVHSYTYCRFNW